MKLSERLQGTAAERHRQAGTDALADPEYASTLARARVRLTRVVAEAVPETPQLSPADVAVLEAFERHGLQPITVVLFGQDRPGTKQIAARLELRHGVPRTRLGVAVMDEYGELSFRAEQSPPPMADRRAS